MSFLKYNNYLKKRSLISKIYRNFYLYPILQKNLKNPVLDVGCGIGDYLKFNRKSIGADINPFNIDTLILEGHNAVLIKNEKLDFKDNSFNSVLLDNVLEHISEPKPLLEEIKRVLCRDGILLIGLPGLKGYNSDDDHKINYSNDELNSLIEPLGFKLEKKIMVPLKLSFLSKVLKQFCTYTYFKKL